MSLTRRDFVKLCSGTVAGLGVAQLCHPGLLMAMKEGMQKHPVIWIQGQGCTGCSVSILNTVNPSIKQVLLDIISMEFHPTIMACEGQTAMEHMYAVAEKYKGKFFLAVEGAVPMAADGKYCVIGEMHGADGKAREITMLDAVTELGAMSGGVLALGTCAAYGGIPAAEGNVTEATGVGAVFEKKGIKTPVVNIPGCPPHPDWMVGSIAYVLTQGSLPELDGDGRPTLFFGENIHENCPYVDMFDNSEFAETFTSKGCRYEIGCKGPSANADCFKRRWNGGVNWCIENAVCIGCVEPTFPDGMSPFYEPE